MRITGAEWLADRIRQARERSARELGLQELDGAQLSRLDERRRRGTVTRVDAAKKSLSTCSGDAGRLSAHHPVAASNAAKRTTTPAAMALRRVMFSRLATELLLSARISETAGPDDRCSMA